jgi:hypothetical protein
MYTSCNYIQKMVCKYCKKTTHLIDDCPEIICKKCKLVGHPFWKCRNILKKNTQTNNTLDESNDTHSNGELDENQKHDTRANTSRTNDDRSYGNRSNGNRSNGNRSGGGSRVGDSNYYRNEKSGNSVSFERKFNEMGDKVNASKMSVINRNLPKAPLTTPVPVPVPVPVAKVEVETTSDTNEESWVNVLVSSDNRISYFHKYKNTKWSELC